MLRKSGDRCCTTTKAIPGFEGRCAKNFSSDSRPPADAPMPTIEKRSGCSTGDLDVEPDEEYTTTAPTGNSRSCGSRDQNMQIKIHFSMKWPAARKRLVD